MERVKILMLMNNITFLKKKQEKKYKKYILQHKKNIIKAFYEMINCKDLEWILGDAKIIKAFWFRILEHDDSKYDEEEFIAYRKNFFPINEEEKINNIENFKKAWQHHLEHNDHHWQHRIDWKDCDFNINTELACLENIADWLAMGYHFHNRPFEYYEKHKKEITLPQRQKEFIEKCIYEGVDKKFIKEKDKIQNDKEEKE